MCWSWDALYLSGGSTAPGSYNAYRQAFTPNPLRLCVPEMFQEVFGSIGFCKTHSSNGYVKKELPKYSLNVFVCCAERSLLQVAGSAAIYQCILYRLCNEKFTGWNIKKGNADSFISKMQGSQEIIAVVFNNLSLVATPGVTSSVTPRFTIPFTDLGSSNWSQISNPVACFYQFMKIGFKRMMRKACKFGWGSVAVISFGKRDAKHLWCYDGVFTKSFVKSPTRNTAIWHQGYLALMALCCCIGVSAAAFAMSLNGGQK